MPSPQALTAWGVGVVRLHTRLTGCPADTVTVRTIRSDVELARVRLFAAEHVVFYGAENVTTGWRGRGGIGWARVRKADVRPGVRWPCIRAAVDGQRHASLDGVAALGSCTGAVVRSE